MFYKQDWIMKQIEQIVAFIAKAIFKKDSINYEPGENDKYLTDDKKKKNELFKQLIKYIDELNLKDGENLLLSTVNYNDIDYLEIAVDFYQRINKLSDEHLETANFSREEIKNNLNNILSKYNIPTIF